MSDRTGIQVKKGALLIVTVILVAAFAYGIQRFISQNSEYNGGNEVACTQEALQCPDGSYVGRTGPRCEFSPCPVQPSFIGTLQQDSSGFALVMGSPEIGVGEVAYRMPLVLKVSNVVGQLVGRNVRVYGSFTEGATLSVDRLEELTGDAGDPTRGDAAIGESIFINGVRVTLNAVVQDNRCPIDVVCIQAGWVTANVTLQSNTDKKTFDIASNAAPIAFDSYHISIEHIEPSRVASAPPPAAEHYLLTFRVRAN